MKNVKLIVTGAVCTIIGISAGMGAMYGIQKKKIDFANDNSLLMEVQDILRENDKSLPDGADKEKAAAKGYLTQFDKFTYYVDKSDGQEEEEEPLKDIEAEIVNGNKLYIKINGFLNTTNINYVNNVAPLVGKADGIIIDLRNNGGGVVAAENEISENFLKEGSVRFVYDNGEEENKRMIDNGNEISLPVVILVNGNTASAAEVMTALFMQYYDNVTVVGTQTYGTGVFQDIKSLSNGDEIRFTNGHYTVGDWESYNEVGITPDIILEMDDSLIGTFSDSQLKKALEILG